MSDARWGDPLEFGARDGAERPRLYDERDRDERDPRDVELNDEDSRALAAVGTFRVVPESDLDTNRDTLRHLRDEGLVATSTLAATNAA